MTVDEFFTKLEPYRGKFRNENGLIRCNGKCPIVTALGGTNIFAAHQAIRCGMRPEDAVTIIFAADSRADGYDLNIRKRLMEYVGND